ncbi:hypothetical protein KSP40_PGU017828 [Platanthera guangdongensis]|uniref:Uncharacterized protein n=1 Tax=Platanthera guangdongensis TaxID=2320717 RepID=A0ABR2MTE7_9ASPA
MVEEVYERFINMVPDPLQSDMLEGMEAVRRDGVLAATLAYVSRDNTKNESGKEKSTYTLVARRDEWRTEKSDDLPSASMKEETQAETGFNSISNDLHCHWFLLEVSNDGLVILVVINFVTNDIHIKAIMGVRSRRESFSLTIATHSSQMHNRLLLAPIFIFSQFLARTGTHLPNIRISISFSSNSYL